MSHVDDGTLHAYLDGELSPAERQGVDAHLVQCPACRERHDEERALIAGAAELLAFAAPPDREVPALRAGDVKPPARLWWQVRLPLAWAATVLLALGIGTYLGSGSAAHLQRPVPVAPAPAALEEHDQARDRPQPEKVEHPSRRERRENVVIAKRAAPPAPAPAPAVAPVAAAQEMVGHQAAARDALNDAAAPRADSLSAAVAAGFTLDSARVVLGHDPVVIPGMPIRAVRRERQVGYTAIVVIEQQLDTSTVVELVERVPAAMRLDGIGVTGAGERAAEPRPDFDSLAAQRRGRIEAPAAKVAARAPRFERQTLPMSRIGNLDVQIVGPLPTDSLQKLLQLLRPVVR
jgi:Putative zinc-finger